MKDGPGPRRVALGVITSFIALELVAILANTSGHVLFSLDDPYIHLRLAESLATHFHYGLNSNEASAPASSILYPFLLTPLVAIGLGQYASLLLCLSATLASGLLLCEILEESGYDLTELGTARHTLLVASTVLFTNLIGVAFTGLEHALQITFALCCVLGTLRFAKSRQVHWWWLASAFVAPLLRYEGLSFFLYTGIILAWYRRFVPALLLLAAGSAAIFGFSFFLWSHGLPLLPSSVLTKASAAIDVTQAAAEVSARALCSLEFIAFGVAALLFFFAKCQRITICLSLASVCAFGAALLINAYGLPQLHDADLSGHLCAEFCQALGARLVDPVLAYGFPQLLILAALIAMRTRRMFSVRNPLGLVAFLGLFVILAHLVAGKMGWFCRYQTYAIITGIAVLAVIQAPEITRWLRDVSAMRLAGALLGGFACMLPFVLATLRTPGAARNIYDQQFQMHRFVTEFYHGPVAVNDIGEVGYGNPSYVLDLWGLGSESARKARLAGKPNDWMDMLAKTSDADLVMINPYWFPSIPKNWIKLAILRVDTANYTLASTEVLFCARTQNDALAIRPLLTNFARTLPDGDVMDFAK